MPSKTILITGATDGVGKATAYALARLGHHVIVHGRSLTKINDTVAAIKAETNSASVDFIQADLNSLAAVKQMADQIKQRFPGLQVLINNAAAMFSQRTETADGLEAMFGVNYLAMYVLTEELIPLLKTNSGSRIINYSSVGYKQAKPDFDDLQLRKSYAMQRDYFNSKLYCLYYTLDLAERLKPAGIPVNAVHPGGVRTQLARDFRGLMKVAFDILMPLFFISPEKGAETGVYLATADEAQNQTGQYWVKSKPEALTPIGLNQDNRKKLAKETIDILNEKYFMG